MEGVQLLRIYISSAMDSQKIIKEELTDLFDVTLFNFVFPKLILNPDIWVPYFDLKTISNCDIVLCFMNKPSIGTTSEISYTKWMCPDKPIIGYKCIDHPWLKYLLSINCKDINCLQNILQSISKSYKEVL